MATDALKEHRGFVLERSVNLEWLINATISQHFFGQVRWDFISTVLYDEYFSFGLKCSVLEKILGDGAKRTVDDLRHLGKIRNHFAHRGPHVSTPSNPTAFAPDPRAVEKPLNFEQLFQDFRDLYPKVEKAIIESFVARGGQLSTEPPWPSA